MIQDLINSREIKAVIFDYDNTISDENYWEVARWEKTNRFVEEKYKYKYYSDNFWRIYSSCNNRKSNIVNDTISAIGGDINLVQKIVKYFKNVIVEEKLLDGVLECLIGLKEKYTIGIITNGKKETHFNRIKSANITQIFDIIIYAYHNPKPSKTPFLHCAAKLGLEPKKMIYVGDNYKTDYEPAQKVGYLPILYDPDYKNTNYTGINVIRHFSDLHKILK